MNNFLIQLLTVVVILKISASQIVFEYDYDFHFPEGRQNQDVGPSIIFPIDDVETHNGADAELPCGVKGEYRHCAWELGRGNVVVPVDDKLDDLNPLKVYARPKNSKDNQCGITIKRVASYHGGKWTCKIFVEGKTLQRSLELTVLDLGHYHKYSGLYFSQKQCPLLFYTFVGKSLEWCKKKCDKTNTCSVFNYDSGTSHKDRTCTLRNCGLIPPYPIGKGTKLQGYSKNLIQNGYTKYYGPYSKIWNSQQGCNRLKRRDFATYVQCENACDEDHVCTGFNFDLVQYDCELFHCSDRALVPNKKLIGWESWSKWKIEASMIFPTHDVEAYEGADVELPCGVKGEYSRCEWEHGSGAVVQVEEVLNLQLYDKPKYSKDNQCGITIKRVESYFEGQWTCKIFFDGKIILKSLDLIVLDRSRGPYHRYSGLYFTDKQCPLILHYYGQPFQWCENKCDEINSCSVFNYLSGGGQKCTLINCGKFPPYPIGTGSEWQSFSKNVIKVGYTRYHGPYSKIWHAEQGCTHLEPRILFATYFTCQNLCDSNQKCTGFNFNIKVYDCDLFHCSDPTLAPDQELNGWEGWSKTRIKEYTSVYHKYDLHWTNKQCRFISQHRNISRRGCEDLCNAQTGCTALNWKNYERGCELYKCSTTPPFPIGAIKGWNGYSTYKITSAGRYYGPYGVYWEKTQCDYLRTHYYETRVECEEICDSTVNCIGFNFKRERGNCVMIQCATNPPPEPSGHDSQWESFSKTKFQEKEYPLLKCPSYHCREENVPTQLKKLKEPSFWRHKLTYCCDHPHDDRYECGDFCSCHSSTFCWYNCEKCSELKNNDPLTKYYQSKSSLVG